MEYEFIKVEKRDRVTIVTINRPEVRNGLHPPACREMNAAFDDFRDDPSAWAAIVTGAGDKAFCAGNDLKWQAEHGPQALRSQLDAIPGGFGGLAKRFDCLKPIIAAVNGLALGGGFEIALASDIIVASTEAFFGLPEPRVGMIANQGGVHRLPRRLPYHLAMGLMLTGDRLSAVEAARLGLVNQVVEPARVMEAALSWAGRILECAPLAVRASKEAVMRAIDLPLDQAVHLVLPGLQALRDSEDLKEGPRAFAEKRKPVWQGK
jgi:crotonobetainyl-CoA hydratase